MVKQKDFKTQSGFISSELTSEFQSFFKDEFGKNVKRLDAQQIALRVAEFVFLKEVRNQTATY